MAIDFTPHGIAEQMAVCEAATPGKWVAVEKGNSVPFVAIVRYAPVAPRMGRGS